MNKNEILESFKTIHWSIDPLDSLQYYFAIKYIEKKINLHPGKGSPTEIYNYVIDKEKKYLRGFNAYPLVDARNGEVFDRLYESLVGYSLAQFAEEFQPDCVKNINFYSELETYYSKRILLECYFLYVLVRIPIDLPRDKAYEQFKSLYSGDNGMLDEEEFWKLYRLKNWHVIQDETKIKAAAKVVNGLLNNMFASEIKKCEIVDTILQHLPRLKSKEVSAPASYVAKILYDDSKALKKGDAETIDKVIGQLSKSITFLDFLTVIMNNGRKSESLAECGLLFPLLQEGWKERGSPPVCLVNTIPQFFEKWGLTATDSITVPFKTATGPVSKLVNASVYDITELEKIGYKEKQEVLYFARGLEKNDVLNQIKSLCRDGATVYAVLPDIFKGILFDIDGYVIQSATILPKEVYSHGRKKHFIAKLVHKDKGLSCIQAQTVKTEKIDRHYYYAESAQWDSTLLSRGDFATNEALRSLFTKSLKRTTNVNERKLPKVYAFSKEIKLWYNVKARQTGENDVHLYLCEIPKKKSEKRNKLRRGKKEKTTEIWKYKLKDDEIKEWIESDGAFRDNLRKKGIEQIEQYYKEDLSLKTLWYCLFDRCSFTEAEEETLKKIVKHDAVANLMIGNVSEEEIKEAVEQSGGSYETIIPLLDTLFDVAVRRKYIKIHPFESMHAARRNQKRREDSVRALAKRSYTNAEEDKIWEFYQKNKEDSSALGMLICFFTGLSVPFVCALTWGDLKNISMTGHKKLAVNKRMLQNTEIEWQTEEKNCRLLPISDCLAIELNEWVKDHNSPKDSRIVSTIGNPINAVRKQIIDAEKYAGIAEDKRNIPEEDYQTDLNKYSGNRMRPNFEFRCYADCGMTDAEVHHLLLNEMPDTLSKNYVDFGHECIQDRMAVKLNQWGQRFLQPKENGQTYYRITKQMISLSTQGERTESYNLFARTNANITISAECDHDCEFRILTYAEREVN